MNKTNRLARSAILTALALALSAAESLVPLTILVPVPGLKIGLSSLVTMYALCVLSGREALLILVCRCFMGSMMGGRLTSFAFSLSGGLLSFFVMWALLRVRGLSLFGVSMAGAAAHNVGQILAACVVLGSTAPTFYLPILLFCSLFTGAVTGGVTILLLKRLPVRSS